MDGSFVPNYALGTDFVKGAKAMVAKNPATPINVLENILDKITRGVD